MRFPLPAALLVLVALVRGAASEEATVLGEPRWIKGEAGVLHLGQPAAGGAIDLTATNGFFDRGFVAVEAGPTVPGDKGLIATGFGALAPSRGRDRGEARWHLLVAQPGEVRVALRMSVPASEAGRRWTVRVGGESREVRGEASDGRADQPVVLAFTVAKPGKLTIAMSREGASGPEKSLLRRLRLTGPAIGSAHLLRARWRPAAVHARFKAPEGCREPTLWVFETRSETATASYSPMTTPFGYFGTLFDARGKIAPGAGFNFSMWVANANAKGAPPLPEMSRLLGTSLPEARYSTFGHEGTGVKFRGAVAYPAGAERTIQALRAEGSGALRTFHGYFYDEALGRWRLYASAQDPNAKARASSRATLASTGSFCEVPGPPATERTGDVVRSILRRGWFRGSDGRWHAAELAGGGERREADNQRVGPAGDGWFRMSTGGVDFHPATAKLAEHAGAEPTLPDYLAADKTPFLLESPVTFLANSAKPVAPGVAEITYQLGKMGPSARATLHYGTVDCITFVAGKPVNNSPAERDIYAPERTWQRSTPPRDVAPGTHVFRIEGLTPGTTYHYRLFVSHAEGKSWDAVSGSFVAR